jgi:hypothetical protein
MCLELTAYKTAVAQIQGQLQNLRNQATGPSPWVWLRPLNDRYVKIHLKS